MKVKFAGALPALLPILVTFVSHEMIQQLFDRLIDTTTGTLLGAGWDQAMISTLAVILGAVASGVVAKYKQMREDQLAAEGSTIEVIPMGGTRSVNVPPNPVITVPPKTNPFLWGY